MLTLSTTRSAATRTVGPFDVFDDSDPDEFSNCRIPEWKKSRTLEKKAVRFCEKVFINITAGFFTKSFWVFPFFFLRDKSKEEV
jgi:hypothetical protein